MEAKAIESIDLITLTCQTISSDHVLIYPNIGGAIPSSMTIETAVTADDRDGHGGARQGT